MNGKAESSSKKGGGSVDADIYTEYNVLQRLGLRARRKRRQKYRDTHEGGLLGQRTEDNVMPIAPFFGAVDMSGFPKSMTPLISKQPTHHGIKKGFRTLGNDCDAAVKA